MDLQKFYSICLQGDVIRAIEYLEAIKDKDTHILDLEKRYKDRFISQNENYTIELDDPWIKEVLDCYFTYFRTVLTSNSVQEAEIKLISTLRNLLGVSKQNNLDEIEEELDNIFKKKGYSFLGGITPPFRGPYIWKTTNKMCFNVSLPSGKQNVTVYIISDFLMLSWAHYATMGRHYSGGWAKSEGLYYVNASDKEIDVNAIEFQISFLKHEAQHFSDFEKYPKLNAANLEYRAKLIELIYNPTPHILIEKFIAQSKNDIQLPHPYAAFLIIKRLSSILFEEDFVEDKDKWERIDSKLIYKGSFHLFTMSEDKLKENVNSTEDIIC